MATIVFALLSANSYGSADFLGGLATRRSSVMPVIILSELAGLITLLLVLPFLPPTTATHADFAWGALAGAALGIGLMLLYQGLATGKMSVVAPVTAVLAVVVSAVAGIVLGDRLSMGAFLGVVLAIGAITLISQDGAQKATRKPGLGMAHGLLPPAALSAGVLIGVFFAALKQSSPTSGLLLLVSARLAALVVLGFVAYWRRPPLRVGRDAVWLILSSAARSTSWQTCSTFWPRVWACSTIAATLDLALSCEHHPSRALGSW